MYCKGTGKKKTSISRILLKEYYEEIIKINNKDYKNYFPKNYNTEIIKRPINLINKKFKIIIKVKGGGIMSQIISIMYGIAKAILDYNLNFKNLLSKNKLLTRDSRIVERKKLGKLKSRKSEQYSKR